MPNYAVQDIEDWIASPASEASDALAACIAGDSLDARQAHVLRTVSPRPWALVILELPTHHGQVEASDVANVVGEMTPNAAVVSSSSTVVALVSYEQARNLVDSIGEKAKLAKCPVCVSLPFDSPAEIPQQLKLARFSLENGESHDAKQTALAFLKAEITGNVNLESVLHPALKTIERYDKENRSNLLETLRMYLINDRNAQRCANQLYLHRNSLQYRIKRIQEIAGIDLDDPDERAYLRLSFFLK